MYEKLDHQNKHSNSNHDHWYDYRAEYVDFELRDKFIKSKQDEETCEFLNNCYVKSDWLFTHFYHAVAKAVLTWFMTSTSINGLVGRGSMFVFSSAQFLRLLDVNDSFKLNSLLDLGRIADIQWQHPVSNAEIRLRVFRHSDDNSISITIFKHQLRWLEHVLRMSSQRIPRRVLFADAGNGWKKQRGGQCMTWCRSMIENYTGLASAGLSQSLGAGDGNVTLKMAPYFKDIFVTEISPVMRWRLSKHGFTILDVDSWELMNKELNTPKVPSHFDVISCLNLLDRCTAPITLLKRISQALKPTTGILILGIVLPLKQYVETTHDQRPIEVLEIIDSEIWEIQLSSLINNILIPANYHVLRWTRLPYLCEGDFSKSFYYLNEIILVLQYSISNNLNK
ncbi:unnamed protein product [Schistosoma mattheei]|uniref:Uncharacterized protein n=1 Tax=Schistosoma mattheei TaxID=31246 RepID=A0A183P0Z4_9TREM|nr:unnamed protein product [Schistosoma mattheei]